MRKLWIAGCITLLAPTASAAEQLASKDASLIQSSLCCGGDVSNRNFGANTTVDAGRYHHASRALIGFSLRSIDAGADVQLVLPGSTVGSGNDFGLSLVTGDWDEFGVTFHTAPASEPLASKIQSLSDDLRFDVTAEVHAALASGKDSISFIIDARGSSNLFVPSRENVNGLKPAFLEWN